MTNLGDHSPGAEQFVTLVIPHFWIDRSHLSQDDRVRGDGRRRSAAMVRLP